MIEVNMETEFFKLRNEWALKMPYPDKDTLDMYMRLDMAKNPHGDSHKPKRRSTAEIVSDMAYGYADEILKQQYGFNYRNWLNNHTEKDGHYNYMR